MSKANQEGDHPSQANTSRFSNETGDHGYLRFKLVDLQPLPKGLYSSIFMAIKAPLKSCAIKMSSFI